MKKVLIIYNYILHYRIPFFNELAKHFDVTVAHSGTSKLTDEDSYKEVLLNCKKIGPFFFQRGLLKEIKTSDYDIIITLFDLRWVMSIYLFLKMKLFFDKRPNILWGAWLTKSALANRIRFILMRMNQFNVFYTYKSKIDFVRLGLKDENCYVANNTFDVPFNIRMNCSRFKDKKYILTIGSLNKRKEINTLIDGFHAALPFINDDIQLVVIGDGEERSNLISHAEKLNLSDRVLFLGAINDPVTLIEYYQKAIFCTSYGQAGLFVLQAFGNGVPFLTKKSAISGGEKYNIQHSLNGYFLGEELSELTEYILFMCNDIGKARAIGNNAYLYYTEFCTIKNMTNGFLDSIYKFNNTKVDERQGNYDF